MFFAQPSITASICSAVYCGAEMGTSSGGATIRKSSTPTFEGFRQGLQEHGYAEGRNIGLEFRYAQGAPEKLPAMAIELVKMKVDVIVTESILAAVAAKQASATIPIVMAVNGDPLEAGLVASLPTRVETSQDYLCLPLRLAANDFSSSRR